MTGSQETRSSWHGGEIAGGVTGGLPLGSSGNILQRGVWAAQVPWGGKQCQVLMELDDALPVEGVSPYIRVHPLSCIPSTEAAVRNQHRLPASASLFPAAKISSHNSSAETLKAVPSVSTAGVDVGGNNAVEAESQALRSRRTGDIDTLNISSIVNNVDTSQSVATYQFTLGGTVVSFYVPLTISAAPGDQYFLIQPLQSQYLGVLLSFPHHMK